MGWPKQTALTDSSLPGPMNRTSTLAGPPATTRTTYPLLGMAETRSMNMPLQATLTTPPGVEYVAIGRGGGLGPGGGGGGRLAAPGTVVAGAGGMTGEAVTSGRGSGEGGAATRGPGLATAGSPPLAGIVEVGPSVTGVVELGDGAWTPDWPAPTSLSTSSWARTGAGRSATSAATIDVAAQTTAVEPTVAASHNPVANNRVRGTRQGCPRWQHPRAKERLRECYELTLSVGVQPIPLVVALDDEVLARKFADLWPHLNERQRRLVVGAEAKARGRGG